MKSPAYPLGVYTSMEYENSAAHLEPQDKTVRPLMRMHPDDPNAANLLKQIEAILAWRATIPPENHFWKVS